MCSTSLKCYGMGRFSESGNIYRSKYIIFSDGDDIEVLNYL